MSSSSPSVQNTAVISMSHYKTIYTKKYGSMQWCKSYESDSKKVFPCKNGCCSSLSTQTFCGDGRTASTGRFRAYHFCFSSHSLVMPFLLFCGDTELDPGHFAVFTVCTLNIKLPLNDSHSTDVSHTDDSDHLDQFCLIEAWTKLTIISAGLIDH